MELVWEHVTCVCLCVCVHELSFTSKYCEESGKDMYQRIPTGHINVHSLSLWKDCLNVFQVWYFLQGSWNHEPANQPYYCRWWVILLLTRNLNCLTLTLFFPVSGVLQNPSEIWKFQPSNGKCTKSISDIGSLQLLDVKLSKPPSSLMTFGLFVIHLGPWSTWCLHRGGSGRRTSNCLKMLPCDQMCWSHSWLLHLTGVSKIERQASGTQVLQHFGT